MNLTELQKLKVLLHIYILFIKIGYVSEGRVDGNLNLSRCIGDFEYKKDKKLSQEEQKIIAVPDFKSK